MCDISLQTIKTVKGAVAALLTLTALGLTGCNDVPEYDNNNLGNFDALWTVLDQRYCFFEQKQVNWDSIGAVYRPRAEKALTRKALFEICSAMLDELRDGHVNLSAPFATSYYRKWWSDYPENYSERLIEEHYFNFTYSQLANVSYGILSNNIGYIRYPSFSVALGHGNIDYILNDLRLCNGLVFDIRSNGGGDLTNVELWVQHFITSRLKAGSIVHKTGPGHNDFSEPFDYYYEPLEKGHILWSKPVAILTDRSTFSAANNFVAVMKQLPNVIIVGATTGGGSGIPFSSELPNGWGVRFSSSSILDYEGQVTEMGIEPTEGCAVNLDPADALNGHDTILDAACRKLNSL